MGELLEPTNRQRHADDLKGRLREAMAQILEKYDYNTVTIRNICKVSGVSYGSFYNLFESKEDFLRYYLTSDFVAYKDAHYLERPTFNELDPIDKSIDIFVCCARYNVDRGLRFIRAFYSPQNTSLCPLDVPDGKEYSFSPLAREATGYLEQALAQGLLNDSRSIASVVSDYCFAFNGITFNWCISNGHYDIEKLVERQLSEIVRPLRTA